MSPIEPQDTLTYLQTGHSYSPSFNEAVAFHNASAAALMSFIRTTSPVLAENEALIVKWVGKYVFAVAAEEQNGEASASPEGTDEVGELLKEAEIDWDDLYKFRELVRAYAVSFMLIARLESQLSESLSNGPTLPELKISRDLMSSSLETAEYFWARDELEKLESEIVHFMLEVGEKSESAEEMDEDDDGIDEFAARDIIAAVSTFCDSAHSKDALLAFSTRSDLYDIADDYGMESPEDYWELKNMLDKYEQLAIKLMEAADALDGAG